MNMGPVLYIFQSLKHRFGEMLLYGFPLFLAIAFLSASSAILGGLKKQAFSALSLQPDITVQFQQGGRIAPISPERIQVLKKLTQPHKSFERVWGFIPIEYKRNEGLSMGAEISSFTLSAFGLWPEELGIFLEGTNIESQFPREKEDIIIGKTALKSLNAQLGDNILLYDSFGNSEKFHITGTFSGKNDSSTDNMLVGNLEKIRDFFGYPPDHITDFGIIMDKGQEEKAIELSAKLFEMGFRIIQKEGAAQYIARSYGERGGNAALVWTISLLAIIAISWGRMRSVQGDRRKETHILRLCGWTNSQIMLSFGLEALFISLVIGFLGIGFGIVWTLFDAPLIRGIFFGWSNLYGDFNIIPHLEISELFFILLMASIPFILATIVPSWLSYLEDPK